MDKDTERRINKIEKAFRELRENPELIKKIERVLGIQKVRKR